MLSAAARGKSEKIFWKLYSHENDKRMRKVRWNRYYIILLINCLQLMTAHITGTDHSEHSLEYESCNSTMVEASNILNEGMYFSRFGFGNFRSLFC